MSPAEDQGPIEQLLAHRAHPALGEGVGPWRTDRGKDDPRTLGPEHRIEGARELGVSIANQVPNTGRQRVLHVQVPSLLGGVAGVGVAGRGHQVDPAGTDLDEEQDVEGG